MIVPKFPWPIPLAKMCACYLAISFQSFLSPRAQGRQKKYPYILDPIFEEVSIAKIKNYLPSLQHQTPFLYTGDEHTAKALIRGHDHLLNVNCIYSGLGDVNQLRYVEA